jgi:hypothetical protein
MDGSHRLPGFTSQVADLHQVPTVAHVVERAHTRPLRTVPIGRGSAALHLDGRTVDASEQGQAVMVGHGKT